MLERAPRVLGEEVLSEQGSFRRVRQYIAGHHPKLGKLHDGWTGPETIIERDQIKPLQTVRVTPTLPKGCERFGKSLSSTQAEMRQALWR